MATPTVEVPDELMIRVKNSGRPVDEVVIQALKRELDEGVLAHQAEARESSREEIIRRLEAASFIEPPSVWNRPAGKIDMHRRQHFAG